MRELLQLNYKRVLLPLVIGLFVFVNLTTAQTNESVLIKYQNGEKLTQQEKIIVDNMLSVDRPVNPYASGTINKTKASTLLAEDFEGGVPPAGWASIDNEGEGVIWETNVFWGAPNETGTGLAAHVDSDAAGSAEFDAELRTPDLNIAGMTAVSISYAVVYSNFANYDFLDLDVSTDGGTTWTNVLSWNEDHLTVEYLDIDLSPFVVGESTMMVRWRYYDPNAGDWDWYAQIDDVEILGEGAATPAEVTFQVNLGVLEDHGDFDPLTQDVYVRGNFNGWDLSAQMTPVVKATETWYEYTLTGVFVGDELEFKYFFDNPDTWESRSNRTYTIGGATEGIDGQITTAASYVAGSTADYEFILDLTSLSGAEWADLVEMTFPAGFTVNGGDAMLDDAPINPIVGQTISWGDDNNSFGDIYAPGVYNFNVNLTVDPGVTGDQNVDYHISGDEWGDLPHEVYGTVTLSETPPVYLVTIQHNFDDIDGFVFYTFNVDMIYQHEYGFDPGVDPLYVRGSFNGWGTGNEMDPAKSIPYTETVEIPVTKGIPFEYKYMYFDVDDGNAEVWEVLDEDDPFLNRSHTPSQDDIDAGTVVFDLTTWEDFIAPVFYTESTGWEDFLNSGEIAEHTMIIENQGEGDLEIAIVIEDLDNPKHLGIRIPRSDGNFEKGEHPVSAGPAPKGTAQKSKSELALTAGTFGYGIDSGFDTFVEFDLATPGTTTNLGGNPNTSFAGAATFSADDQSFVYSMGSDGDLFAIDIATGSATNIGTIAPPSPETWSGMAVDPTDGSIYAVSTDISGSSLSLLDIDGLSSTLIGDMGIPGAIALAIDGSGTFYTYDIVNDEFAMVDKNTGAGTIIGPLGFDANFGQGMCWDPNSDQIYMAAFNNTSFQAELRLVDPTTGNSILVDPIGTPGTSQLGGLAILGDLSTFWATVSPKNITIPAFSTQEFTVKANSNGLDLGTYSANIHIANNDPYNQLTTLPITMHIGANLTGSVVYLNGEPVPGVNVYFTENVKDPAYTAVTDEDGIYNVPFMFPGSYTISIDGDYGDDDVINTRDILEAQKMANKVIPQPELGTMHFMAVDVSGNGAIRYEDPLLMFDYLFGLIDGFEAYDEWIVSEEFLDVMIGAQDFYPVIDPIEVVIPGDVNLSYGLDWPYGGGVVINPIDDRPQPLTDEIEVPVYAASDVDLSSLVLNFDYPNESYEFVSLNTTLNNVRYDAKENRVMVAGFMLDKPVEVKAGDEILTLKFKKTNDKKVDFFALHLEKGAGIIVDKNGKENNTNLTTIQFGEALPTSYKLAQNYPNPFNPATKIEFSLPEATVVSLKVYDILGSEVATLINEKMEAGNYTFNFDASKLPSGAYIYRIITDKFQATKKMMLLK
ncbi:MAG: T9SS type A sorting domain-containing protein [Melioribacteraceae bacterium]|nr:T9SS type A sorting domain-containing protein [Melioribacteraceae bacterium]